MKTKLKNSKSEISMRHLYTRSNGFHVCKVNFKGNPYSYHKHYSGFYDVELTPSWDLANGLELPLTIRRAVIELLANR